MSQRGTQAFNLMNELLPQIDQKLAIFNVLINAALKCKNLSLARALYHKISTISLGPGTCLKPNEVTIALFVEYAGKMAESGLGLLEEFNLEAEKHQITRGPRYYSALFRALAVLDGAKMGQVLGEAVAAKAVDRRLLECIAGLLTDTRIPSYLKLELYVQIEGLIKGKQPKDSFVASMFSLIDSRVLEVFAAIEEKSFEEHQKAIRRANASSPLAAAPGLLLLPRQATCLNSILSLLIGQLCVHLSIVVNGMQLWDW